MFSAIEKEALRIILGMRGEQPKNIGELGTRLFPDVNPSAPSRDTRVQGLKGVLAQRSRSKYSMYFRFYFKKRRGEKFSHPQLLPEDLAFLEEIFQQCSTWLTFREKVCTVLEGSNLKTMARGEKEIPTPPNVQ